MDNTVLPYKDQLYSSDESDSSDSSEEGNMLTNNIGILYNGSDIKDDGISHKKEGGLKLNVKYETLENGSSKVFAKLV